MSTAAGGKVVRELEAWVAKQRELLVKERDAELNETLGRLATTSDVDLQAAGLRLKVVVSELEAGLYGRTVITVAHPRGLPLPSHSFTVGDVAGIASSATTVPVGVTGEALRRLYGVSGVVTAVSDTRVSIAVDDREAAGSGSSGSRPAAAGGAAGKDAASAALGIGDGEMPDIGDTVRVDKLADDVTYRRLVRVLDDIGKYEHGPAHRLLRILFPGKPPAPAGAASPPPATASASAKGSTSSTGDKVTLPEFLPVPPVPAGAAVTAIAAAVPLAPSTAAGGGGSARGLNASQAAAVDAALRARDIVLIHGPPGTGKTTTVCDYLAAEVAAGRKVLACAPSNVAVDNMLERLAVKLGVLGAATTSGSSGSGSAPATAALAVAPGADLRPLVRLGHAARMQPHLTPFSLDAHVAVSEGTDIVKDAKKDLQTLQKGWSKNLRNAIEKGGIPAAVAKRELRSEERRLKGEVRTREQRVVADILAGASVVFTTLTGAGASTLRRHIAAVEKTRWGIPPSAGLPVAASIASGDGDAAGAALGAARAAGSASAVAAAGDAAAAFSQRDGLHCAFDVCVIDEVAQALEASCFIAGEYAAVARLCALCFRMAAADTLCPLLFSHGCCSPLGTEARAGWRPPAAAAHHNQRRGRCSGTGGNAGGPCCCSL